MIWLLPLAFFCLTSIQEGSLVIIQPRIYNNCTVCKGLSLEISFIIDGSSSIWKVNFTEGLWFVQDFVDKFDIGQNKVRVSVVSYGDRVYTEDAINFNTYRNKNDLKNAIGNIPYNAGTTTETGAAIRYLLDKQLPQARTNVRKVIIVLTDGNSQEPEITKAEADRAKRLKLEVFAIGVGYNISLQELHNIASDGRHVLNVDTYSSLNDISRRLEYEVCKEKPVPLCQYDPVDLAFVIDSSSSIGEDNFTLGLEFIKDFIYDFEINPHAFRVAAVMFGARVYSESAIPFNAYRNKKDTINAILGLKWQRGLRTETGMGIDYLVDRFLPNTRPNSAHVAIVITDGRSQDREKTMKAAERARRGGLTIFAVGVGELGVTLDENELRNIAGDPARVMTVTDYYKLNTIKQELLRETCIRIYNTLQEYRPPRSV